MGSPFSKGLREHSVMCHRKINFRLKNTLSSRNTVLGGFLRYTEQELGWGIVSKKALAEVSIRLPCSLGQFVSRSASCLNPHFRTFYTKDFYKHLIFLVMC